VRLWLSAIAYNLGNLWRRLVLPKKIENWSLTSLQQRLVETGGRLVKRARYYWLLLAESHPDEAAVWRHGAADRCVGDRIGVAIGSWRAKLAMNETGRRGCVSFPAAGQQLLPGPVHGGAEWRF